MAGMFDFLTGLLNSGGAGGGSPMGGLQGGLQNLFSNPFGNPAGGAPGGQPPVPAVPEYFKNANPGAAASAAQPQSTNPAALGVTSDQSNPMNNEMMRKMMLAQFLSKQGGQQQPKVGMPSAPGGMPMGGGGGMPMGGQRPGAGVNSMPAPMQARPRFIGSTGGGF